MQQNNEVNEGFRSVFLNLWVAAPLRGLNDTFTEISWILDIYTTIYTKIIVMK